MDEVQEKHERWVGETFIKWCNEQHAFVFKGRAGDAPDLVYLNPSGQELRLEIVTAYYDAENAKFKWLGAREVPGAPSRWSGVNCNDALVASINLVITEKCNKDYGPGCVLVVCILPELTLAEEMERRLLEVQVPTSSPFEAIYLVGTFGTAAGGSGYEERVWRLAGKRPGSLLLGCEP